MGDGKLSPEQVRAFVIFRGTVHRLTRWAIVVAMLWPGIALAQRGQDAALVGTVRDRSGAGLTGARVTASSSRLLGGSLSAAADERGEYRLPLLPPGEYRIVAEHDGFKTVKQESVTLVPGLTFTVDFVLDAAAPDQTVLVEGAPPVVDVRSSAAPVSIDRTLLENLPLAKVVGDAVNLAPGVIRDVGFGGSVRSNPLSLDGASGNEPSWGTPTLKPNLDWIDELQIVSVGADARYGEFTGVRENAITRSGSNTFSGLVDYLTVRPSWTGNNRGSLTPQLQERFRPLEIVGRWDSDVQVGGPVLKDRLWFFAGAEVYRDAYRPAGFTGAPKSPNDPKVDSREPKYIVKPTAAPKAAIRVDGFYAHDSRSTTGANAGPLVQPDALLDNDRGENLWNARLQWTLSPRAFLEIRHGGHHADEFSGPPEERRSVPGHYDQWTGISSQNAQTYSHFQSQPIATSADVTYFANGANGRSHEVRGGYEFEHARLLQASGYNGGMGFLDYDGRPDLVVIGGLATYRPTFNRQTWYVQDGWSAADRLTLNFGVRGGAYNGAVPDRGRVFEARSLSPRVGAAWDVARNHRTVLRVHYGRYHDPMVTTFFDFLDPLGGDNTITARVLGPDQYQEVTRSVSTTTGTIDPDLKFAFVEEYVAGLEHQLAWGVTAGAQYVYKDFKDSIGFIDTGRMWQPVERLDPGPDGRAGTADDRGPITLFYDVDPASARLMQTNPPGAYRRYKALEVVASRRSARNAGFQVSYTWSRTVGSYNNSFTSNAGTADLSPNGNFVNPNRALNTEGRTPQDFGHELKGLWTYRLPVWGGLNVSGVYLHQSGRLWARAINTSGLPEVHLISVLVEPRATRQMPGVHRVDLRLEKTFRPSPRAATVGIFADVFNAGNQGVPLGVTNVSGANFGVPNNWQEPRSLRAGVRLLF